MRKGDKKVFLNDEKKLQEMFKLREKGWSYNALAKKYGCNHTSILYRCQKNSIFNNNIQIIRSNSEVKKKKIIKDNFPDWTEEQKNEAIRMRTEGIFVRIIAGKIGKTIHMVNGFFNKTNLPAITTPSQRASVIKEETLWRDDGSGEKICSGKFYKEYLKDEKKRNSKLDKMII